MIWISARVEFGFEADDCGREALVFCALGSQPRLPLVPLGDGDVALEVAFDFGAVGNQNWLFQ
jgi:hypothetical protein